MLRPEDRLSKRELQYRYEVVQKKMREQDFEVLLVSGIRFVAATGYLRYLTNWAEPFAGEVLVVPAEGSPTFLTRTGERAQVVNRFLGIEAKPGSTAGHTAAVLKRLGSRRVGLCGLKTMLAEYYVQLTSALPDVEFVEASSLLDEVRMVKSEEELVWVRKSATLTDLAFSRFRDLCREGVAESDVFLEIDCELKKLGAENTYFMMSADPRPLAKFLDLAFDTYKAGDLVLFNAEVAGPGGYYTQLERTLSIGPPTDEARTAYAACREALDEAEKLLRPGQRASDVYRTILSSIEGAGYKMGLHPGHSQGLDIFERPLIDKNETLALEAGMVIVLHPHVLLPSGGGVWIGETYVIGREETTPLHSSDRDLVMISKD